MATDRLVGQASVCDHLEEVAEEAKMLRPMRQQENKARLLWWLLCLKSCKKESVSK